MILQIAWSLTFFAGLCLTVSNCFPASPWRAPLRRTLLIAASAGILLAAGFALLLLVNGRPFEHTGPWALPIGSFSLRIGIPEALMLLFVNLMGGVILASLWSEVSELDLGALLILLPALGVCLAARDAVLFLMAWEIMALSGVIWQRGRSTPEDRYDGHGLWAYLASAHLATACLLVALPLLAKLGGSQTELGGPVLWDGQFSRVAGPGTAWALVGLVLAGFGTKAGMFPFHVWIRTVYRNAPARFGAVSSGLMAKVSLFLLIRTMIRIMPLIGPDRTPWVAGLLMMLGMATGLAGLAGALTSARIKVMLGYSSMENVGIILVGFGLGVWGMTREAWTVATFAMVGVWFHMLNHMIAKTCLFLAARNVIRQTHTDDVARLGGLHKRMPVTALAFGAGGLALSAMVPLNAFNSELMIFDGLFRGVLDLGPAGRDLSILAAAVLGLMGGLAAVCFTGLWGLGFLGNPRTPAAEQADEQGISWQNMTVLKLLTFCIVLLGVVPILGYGTVRGAVVDQLKSMGCGESALALAEGEVVSLTIWMSIVAVFLFVMILALKRWRDSRLEKATVDSGPTWDCGFGYTDTFPRGQYGPLSYFDPAGNFVSKWTWQKVHRPDLSEPFPPRRRIRIESADGLFYYLYDPVFRFVGKYLSRLRWIQAGSIQLYLAMMALTLVAMLAWVAAL
jgi:formate hydrogenlyase subunit 3/multisubunit Na+/H+ antiporter MnhD subunit